MAKSDSGYYVIRPDGTVEFLKGAKREWARKVSK